MLHVAQWEYIGLCHVSCEECSKPATLSIEYLELFLHFVFHLKLTVKSGLFMTVHFCTKPVSLFKYCINVQFVNLMELVCFLAFKWCLCINHQLTGAVVYEKD